MAHKNSEGPDVQASSVAQLGAMIGPIIPYLVYLKRRNEEPTSARDAAVATNFGMFAIVVFLGGTAVRWIVPWIGWLGALAQISIVVVAVVLALQAYGSVKRGVPASYPLGITVVRV
jgi:hypothetical protein